MSRAVYQRRTVTCLATLTESDCTVVLQQKCDNATLIIFISTTTTTTSLMCEAEQKVESGVAIDSDAWCEDGHLAGIPVAAHTQCVTKRYF